MLKTEKERSICARYSARDDEGLVHCKECPLVVEAAERICRAISHYDRHLKEWVLDKEADI